MIPPITAPPAFFQAKFLPPICLLSGAVQQVGIFEIHPKQVGDRFERVPGLTVKLPLTAPAAAAWHTRHTHVGFQTVVGGLLVGAVATVIAFLFFGFRSVDPATVNHLEAIFDSLLVGLAVAVVAATAIGVMLARAKRNLEQRYHFPALTYNVATQLVTLEFPPAAAEIAGHFATAYLQWSRGGDRDKDRGPSAKEIAHGDRVDDQWTEGLNQNWDQADKD